MRKIYQLLLCVMICLGWGSSQSASVSENTIYTIDHANIIVNAVKSTFTIQLQSNPTTGYIWFLREYNNQLVIPVSHRFEATQTNRVGASGFEYWVFRLNPTAFIVPQQTTIRFIYARPWQPNTDTTQAVFRVSTMTKS